MFLILIQYAHRACLQRWINEKGDLTCEICHEVSAFSLVFSIYQFDADYARKSTCADFASDGQNILWHESSVIYVSF